MGRISCSRVCWTAVAPLQGSSSSCYGCVRRPIPWQPDSFAKL
uniref:Proteasome subunit beta type 1 n=1 Tax=Arundo donax TaxID=35708 RepID=A0A0A9FPN7_ARUDO